ncbi:hypothetical protein QEH59_18635 [Coraliomargarita sp. SDUM461004]|uniref:Uncharacterized protein n=1 Tax=Thalassobacterium sedimentorum TaxID=3041258 RepID=A0ABU1ANS6_9BACT|nr:hypothetical protein [Coraliomargarita sp. SDUM461004]MDQ8196453.1 hypothetical protein [Coraliomargarita sp. SDUM461004]
MEVNRFIECASDPTHWEKKALSLRKAAEAVWDLFEKEWLKGVSTRPLDIDVFQNELAENLLSNSQLLYGLSAECALKGILIKKDPKSIQFTTIVDGTRNVTSAEISKKGNSSIDTHNLEKLAKEAGVLKPETEDGIKEILAYCTEIVIWRGRYPVPLKTDGGFRFRGKLPGVAFVHYFRDVFDPFLDELFETLKN